MYTINKIEDSNGSIYVVSCNFTFELLIKQKLDNYTHRHIYTLTYE